MTAGATFTLDPTTREYNTDYASACGLLTNAAWLLTKAASTKHELILCDPDQYRVVHSYI
jgi:hypothetical protein